MTGEQKSATQTKKSSSVLPVLPLERRQLFRFVLQCLLYELHHVESHSLMRISLIIVGLRWSHDSSSERNEEKSKSNQYSVLPSKRLSSPSWYDSHTALFFFFNGLLRELVPSISVN